MYINSGAVLKYDKTAKRISTNINCLTYIRFAIFLLNKFNDKRVFNRIIFTMQIGQTTSAQSENLSNIKESFLLYHLYCRIY